MKHRFVLVGCIFMVVGEFLTLGDKVEMGTMTGDRVNIRARPLGTAEICGQLRKGNTVEILERRLVQTAGTNTEEWVRIALPEVVHVWLQAGYLDEKGAVTARINGRAGPGLMWPVLCVLPKGETVHVRTNHVDWVGITPPRNASAWISGRFVTSEEVSIPVAPLAKPQ